MGEKYLCHSCCPSPTEQPHQVNIGWTSQAIVQSQQFYLLNAHYVISVKVPQDIYPVASFLLSLFCWMSWMSPLFLFPSPSSLLSLLLKVLLTFCTNPPMPVFFLATLAFSSLAAPLFCHGGRDFTAFIQSIV